MNEEIKNYIDKRIKEVSRAQTTSLAMPPIPAHRHTGTDSQKILSSDLLPYPIEDLVSDNIYIKLQSPIAGTYVVGETITGSITGATATVVANYGGYLVTTLGFFIIGETITGGTSGATAVINGLSNVGPSETTEDGTISFYQYLTIPEGLNPSVDVDWGFDIYLGNQWNSMTLVSSGVEANQDTAQNIATITETTLICDAPTYDLNFEYDSSSGVFTCNTKGRYLISAAASFQDLSGLTGTIEITAYYEISATPFPLATKSIYIPAGITNADVLTADLTTIQEIPATAIIYVTLYQTTGSTLTTITTPRTWFNVHKMK